MILKNAINMVKNIELFGGTNVYKRNRTYSAPFYTVKNTSGATLSNLLTSADVDSMGANPVLNGLPLTGSTLVVCTSETATLGSYNYVGVAFGEGTEPVSENDFCLSDLITSGLAFLGTPVTGFNIYTNASERSVTKRTNYSFVVQNTSLKNITISEIGLYNNVYTSANPYPVMMYREVLSTPITLQPNEFKTFALEFNITHREV